MSGLILIHGGPGTGKSFLARKIAERAEANGMKLCCAGPTGISSSLLSEGRTLHSLFDLPAKKAKGISVNKENLRKLNPERLSIMKKRLKNIDGIIIDEMSMIPSYMLSQVNDRLNEVLGDSHDLKQDRQMQFGGLVVVLMGDLFQLKPVAGLPLYVAAMQRVRPEEAGYPSVRGGALFRQFKGFSLEQQMRAAEDQVHTKRIENLRKGKGVPRNLLDGIQRLKPSDWLEFAFSPIVVTTNAERASLNERQALRFASHHGTAILRWRKPLRGEVASLLAQEQIDALYQIHPELNGYFIIGAPGHLTENLNPTKGFSNGTPIVFHSVTLPEDSQPRELRRLIAGAHAGQVIEIPPPKSINVIVPSVPVRPAESLDDNMTVIPIIASRYPEQIEIKKDSRISYESHPVEVAFALTFHKVQGQTVDKIILDLNLRTARSMPNIDFHGLYVGISRVRRFSDMRILPAHTSKNFNHLYKLTPDPKLLDWLHSTQKNKTK